MRWLLVGLACVGLCACAGPKRAVLHPDDVAKVFPWPSGKEAMAIRVKPKGKALAEFQEVQVSPETTFYITDELGKQFAYTPKLSPIRRLAPVQEIEVRWPLAPDQAPEKEPAKDPGKDAGKDPAKEPAKDPAKEPAKEPAKDPGKPAPSKEPAPAEGKSSAPPPPQN